MYIYIRLLTHDAQCSSIILNTLTLHNLNSIGDKQMSLWYKLTHRKSSRNVFISEELGYDRMTIVQPIHDVLMSHVMIDWFKMDYYWAYNKKSGIYKVWNLDAIL